MGARCMSLSSLACGAVVLRLNADEATVAKGPITPATGACLHFSGLLFACLQCDRLNPNILAKVETNRFVSSVCGAVALRVLGLDYKAECTWWKKDKLSGFSWDLTVHVWMWLSCR